MVTKEQRVQPRQQVECGKRALRELKLLVQDRPDKLVIHGRQYLYFSDWQTLGAFFDVTASVVQTGEVNKEVPSKDGKLSFKEVVGFWARAVALQDGKEISAAEAWCLFEEENWKNKPRFQLLSMAQTRACAKALRNCLSWVIRLPTKESDGELPLADEVAEEVGSW